MVKLKTGPVIRKLKLGWQNFTPRMDWGYVSIDASKAIQIKDIFEGWDALVSRSFAFGVVSGSVQASFEMKNPAMYELDSEHRVTAALGAATTTTGQVGTTNTSSNTTTQTTFNTETETNADLGYTWSWTMTFTDVYTDTDTITTWQIPVYGNVPAHAINVSGEVFDGVNWVAQGTPKSYIVKDPPITQQEFPVNSTVAVSLSSGANVVNLTVSPSGQILSVDPPAVPPTTSPNPDMVITVPADQEGVTDVWFAIYGANLNLDDDGNVEFVIDAGFMLEFYLGMAEAAGLPRPNVIGS